jgi:hypothetical protein
MPSRSLMHSYIHVCIYRHAHTQKNTCSENQMLSRLLDLCAQKREALVNLLCVCMHACVYVVCMHIQTCVCARAFVPIIEELLLTYGVYVCACVCVFLYMYIYVYMHVHICVYVHFPKLEISNCGQGVGFGVHTCIHVFMHVHFLPACTRRSMHGMRVSIHACVYVCMHACVSIQHLKHVCP